MGYSNCGGGGGIWKVGRHPIHFLYIARTPTDRRGESSWPYGRVAIIHSGSCTSCGPQTLSTNDSRVETGRIISSHIDSASPFYFSYWLELILFKQVAHSFYFPTQAVLSFE